MPAADGGRRFVFIFGSLRAVHTLATPFFSTFRLTCAVHDDGTLILVLLVLLRSGRRERGSRGRKIDAKARGQRRRLMDFALRKPDARLSFELLDGGIRCRAFALEAESQVRSRSRRAGVRMYFSVSTNALPMKGKTKERKVFFDVVFSLSLSLSLSSLSICSALSISQAFPFLFHFAPPNSKRKRNSPRCRRPRSLRPP